CARPTLYDYSWFAYW
nr:immunoglobulin heavy chain junction region [Mus musculus]